MSFIRPEVARGLTRWREALVGAGFIVVALLLLQDSFGGRFWIGVLLALLGLGLIISGIPRARARLGGDGAGVIEVDERRITYFGPLSGGAMIVEDIARIAADPGRRWVLTSTDNERMTIPMDAAGSDALFDAFAALPGLSANRIAQAVQQDVPSRRVIWEKQQSGSG